MEKLLRKGAPAYILQCQEMELLTCEGDMEKQPEIKELIKKHHKVFQELPMELPPNINIEHIIKIEPRTKPASRKPYRYPHHHKTEIKRLTQDLLKSGVISKRTRAYEAPVVLVSKKDGLFILCIDY